MTNLQVRVLAAFIYFPVLLLSTFDWGFFTLAMFFCVAVGWHEYLCFKQKPSTRKEWVPHILKIFWGSLPLLLLMFNLNLAWSLALIGLGFQGIFIFLLARGRDFSEIWEELQYYVFGFLYVTALFSVLVALHRTPGGREALWFLLVIVGVTDSAAYFVGRAVGKTPFFPKASPKKTREGFWGGLLGAILAAAGFPFVLDLFEFSHPHLIICVVLGIIVSLASTAGDLVESLMKRHYKVKDSGNIIAGHGGILDRFDGVIFAALPLFVGILLLGGFR